MKTYPKTKALKIGEVVRIDTPYLKGKLHVHANGETFINQRGVQMELYGNKDLQDIIEKAL